MEKVPLVPATIAFQSHKALHEWVNAKNTFPIQWNGKRVQIPMRIAGHPEEARSYHLQGVYQHGTDLYIIRSSDYGELYALRWMGGKKERRIGFVGSGVGHRKIDETHRRKGLFRLMMERMLKSYKKKGNASIQTSTMKKSTLHALLNHGFSILDRKPVVRSTIPGIPEQVIEDTLDESVMLEKKLKMSAHGTDLLDRWHKIAYRNPRTGKNMQLVKKMDRGERFPR
ncbi:hypothetical protein HY994_01450 [Candidatus Micrarchaeota archaeon]|nr:hypothetical protein [Candidatus Micrarchaeota archaeon]